MIEYKEFTLDNGLRVIVHEDANVQVAVMNILYKVGSKDEEESRTGFAHLFEHLMFEGSVNVPEFDSELQKVGGENNAFTSNDITNYYLTVPYQNLECGFWLESDRMLGLPFDPKALEVQRSVVIEEFKQRYLNQPYGDVWLKLRPLAYKVHPYRWATIGREIKHIEEASMNDVTAFYRKYYNPDNAVMVVAGRVNFDEVRALSEKWFGDIPKGAPIVRNIVAEPAQQEKRRLVTEADVPSDKVYMAFHMPGKFDEGYHAADLLSDILGRETSSRLYRKLVRENQLFDSISAYNTGSVDPGLLVISGKLASGIPPATGEEAVWGVIDELKCDGVADNELDKVKNQALSTVAFGELGILNRAMALAFGALSGDADHVNKEKERLLRVTPTGIIEFCKKALIETNASVMHYLSRKSHA